MEKLLSTGAKRAGEQVMSARFTRKQNYLLFGKSDPILLIFMVPLAVGVEGDVAVLHWYNQKKERPGISLPPCGHD